MSNLTITEVAMPGDLTDVLIIGSGAGAAPAALKLSQSGLKVTVLEKGDWLNRQENPEDELAEIHLERHRPDSNVDPTIVISSGEKIADASRIGQSFYLVGGGTVRYTATSWRLRPEDFRKRTEYGEVIGANVVDWPISYDDLEPFYTEAEKVIGISGLSGADPTEPFRSQNHLMPPLAGDRYQEIVTAAARKLGWNPFPIPLAIHSQPSTERGASSCLQCGWCSGFPCRFHAKSSVDVTVFPLLMSAKPFQLRTRANVIGITLESNNRRKVRSVEYVDLRTKQTHSIQARVVIVAASAVQTSRLLMHSNLANSSGLLGKNLMFHIEARGSACFEEESFHQAFYKKVGIHDFYYPAKTDGFINHRSIQSGSKPLPISFALGADKHGKDFIENIAHTFIRTQTLQCMVEDLAQEKNCVRLSSKQDPWGVPSPEVHHKYHDHDRQAAASALEKMKLLLEASGGTKIRMAEPPRNITDAYTWHLMGTARMGKDPGSSVVNSDCRCHDLDNVFISDGSVFPTSGGLNPTLTIQALSFRVPNRIQSLMLEGKL